MWVKIHAMHGKDLENNMDHIAMDDGWFQNQDFIEDVDLNYAEVDIEFELVAAFSEIK